MEKLYEILVNERERDARRYWTIFGVLSVINGGLFAAVAGTDPERHVTLAACLLGGAVCVIWIGGALRMVAWIRWWEDRLERLEPEYFSSLARSAGLPSWYSVFTDRRLPLGFNGLSTRAIGWLLPSVFLAAWAGLAWLELGRAPDAPPDPPPAVIEQPAADGIL